MDELRDLHADPSIYAITTIEAQGEVCDPVKASLSSPSSPPPPHNPTKKKKKKIIIIYYWPFQGVFFFILILLFNVL